MALIDCDTHLFEPVDMWASYCDPGDRDRALRMEEDDLGYTWLLWGDRRITMGEPHQPGQNDCGLSDDWVGNAWRGNGRRGFTDCSE